MTRRIIIHTERIIPSDEYLQEWFEEMEKTEIPPYVLSCLKESGKASWETRDGIYQVTTTYRIVRDNNEQ